MSEGGRYFLTSEDGKAVELAKDTLIGREATCDLVISDGHPSRRHAQITFEETGPYVEDLQSANGTFLNRVRIHEKTQLKPGDLLVLGLGEFHLSHEVESKPGQPPTDPNLSMLIDPSDAAATNQCRFVLTETASQHTRDIDRCVRLGRESSVDTPVDWVLENAGISKAHAALQPVNDGVLVTDLGSSNGTYINDQRIEHPSLIVHGDCLRLHLVEFTLVDREKKQAANTPLFPPWRKNTALVDAKIGSTIALPIEQKLSANWEMNPTQTKNQAAQQIADEHFDAILAAPVILILSGKQAGQPYRLDCTNTINYWNIGRNPDAYELSIVLDDLSISAFHAKLVCHDGRWRIVDQMVTNSIYVNGQRHGAVDLASSDHIRLGRVDTLLLLPAEFTASAPDFLTKTGTWIRKLAFVRSLIK